MQIIDDLGHLRRAVDRAMVPFLWLQVPVVGAVAWVNGADWPWFAVAAALLATIISVWLAFGRAGAAIRTTIAVVQVAMVSLLVAACAGTAWQIDMHMYYFASLAILAAYCERDVILAATLATAVHHLGLNYLAPALVFPGGGDLARVGLHAAILVLEAGALLWMAQRLAMLFALSATNLAAAEAARDAADAARGEQSRLQAELDASRRQTLSGVADRLDRELRGAIGEMGDAARSLRQGAAQLDVNAGRADGEAHTVSDSAARTTSDVQAVAAAVE